MKAQTNETFVPINELLTNHENVEGKTMEQLIDQLLYHAILSMIYDM